jgi:hypothetical protein
MTGTTGDPGSVSFGISAGEDRLLVVLVACYDSGFSTGQTFSAAYGGQSLTTAHLQNDGGRQTWIGYLNESGITGRSNDTVEVSVTGTHTAVRAHIASYENVDQTSPILNHTGQYSIGITTSLGTLNVNEGGYGIYGWASNGYRESDDESYTEHGESGISNFGYGVASKAFASVTTTNPVITWSVSNTKSVSFITLNPECDGGNNPPVITSDGGGSTATVHADEDQTAVTTVSATDPDAGDILTYSIIGGADQSDFSIGSSSGILTFNSAPDYESPTDANTDGTYEVTVQVTDDDASPLTDTQAISVIVDDVNPPAPTLVSPANGVTIDTTTPTLDWDPVTGIGDVTYSVRWDDENTFSGGPPTTAVGSNTDYTIPSGLAAGTWYWQVQAYDDSGGSGWSSYWSFTIPSPPAPTLVSPANGVTIADTTPTLDWDPVTGIGDVTYSVRWDDENTFSGGPPTAGVGSNTDYTIPSGLAVGTWYWQVQAYDDSGGSGWSSYWSFTISSPPAPTLVSPANGTTTSDNTVDLDWEGDTEFYQVQVDNDSDFSSIAYGFSSTTSSSATTTPLATDTYYWHVRVWVDSSWGPWSETWTFTVIPNDTTDPMVTINQAAAQDDPTNASPINFTVVFSEVVTDFATGDVSLSGTAGATTATVTGSGTTYNVAVSGMTGDGTVIATIAADQAHDAASNGNEASTSTDNTVTYDTTAPDTIIDSGPANPTNSTSASFTFHGTDSGSGVASYECQLDSGGWTACTSPQNYTGLSEGIHTFEVQAIDYAGNTDATPASYTWEVDITAPGVTINQAGTQADPTSASPIDFTVLFSEPVTGFATGDVDLSGGTAPGTLVGTVTEISPNDGTTYNVAVSGMTGDGTIIATIPADAASDAASNGNEASYSTDNTVTYDTSGGNTPPVANPDNYGSTEDSTLTVGAPGVLANDTDVDVDTLSASLFTEPLHVISFTLNSDGSFTYVPDLNWSGIDSFTYRAFDGQDYSTTATATINVTSLNDEPSGADNTETTNEDTDYIFGTADFGFTDPNDSPPDSLYAVKITTLPSEGSLENSGTPVSAGDFVLASDISAGDLAFNPDLNENGSPYTSFTFQVQDDGGTSHMWDVDLDQSPNTMTINVTAVNDPPVAEDNYVGTLEDTPMTFAPCNFQFSDVEGDSRTAVEITSLPANGTLKYSGSTFSVPYQITEANVSNLTFEPASNEYGVYTTVPYEHYAYTTFGYRVEAGGSWSDNTATMHVSVWPVNDDPVAVDDYYSTDEDTLLPVPNPGVLANDSDVDGDSIHVTSIIPPLHGSWSVQIYGGFSYTPDSNYNGPDSFTYYISDGNGGTASATVHITVNPANDCPVIDCVSPETQTVQFSDLIQTITIVAHDVDNDLGELSLGYVPYGLSVDDSTPGTWIVSGQFMDDHAMDWIIGVTDGECETPAATITSLEECAIVRYDSHNPKSVEIDNADTMLDTNAEFTVHIKQDPDGYLGWALLAAGDVTMRIIPVGGGGPITMVQESHTDLSVFATGGTVSFTFTPPGDDLFVINTYIVEVTIDNDYYRACGGEDILAVYDPDVGTTGFGSFIWPEDDSDMAGGEAEFAYIMNYNKKGKNLRGSLLLIVRMDDGTIYRIKSNALYDLALDYNEIDEKGEFDWASFSGKCTYIGPDCEVDAYGNLKNEGGKEFVVYVKDYDADSTVSSAPDEFWFTVIGRSFTLDEDGDNTANEIVELGPNDDIIIPGRPSNNGGKGDFNRNK